jgi:hypothetical protein
MITFSLLVENARELRGGQQQQRGQRVECAARFLRHYRVRQHPDDAQCSDLARVELLEFLGKACASALASASSAGRPWSW